MFQHQLSEARQQGDIAADTCLAALGASFAQTRQVLAKIHTNADLAQLSPYPALDAFVQQHLQLPTWAERARMQRGADLFQRHARDLMAMLGFLSLPYCYAGANGVKVLYHSERLGNDTYKRLLETAEFVWAVVQPDAFTQPQGRGLALCFKVRLMHTAIRAHLAQSATWDTSQWGLPVCQEDMAGTNLAFSWICLRGLRKMGISIAPQDAEDYLHLWNVIGHLLGINDTLLAHNGKQAYWLDRCIRERQFRASDEGQFLTRQLLSTLAQHSPDSLPTAFVPAYMRYLLDDEIANMLGIAPNPWAKNLGDLLRLRHWLLPTKSEDFAVEANKMFHTSKATFV